MLLPFENSLMKFIVNLVVSYPTQMNDMAFLGIIFHGDDFWVMRPLEDKGVHFSKRKRLWILNMSNFWNTSNADS